MRTFIRSRWPRRGRRYSATSLRRSKAARGRERPALHAEQLEDRLVLASNLTIVDGTTHFVSVSTAGGLTVFTSMADDAVLSAAEVSAALDAGGVVLQTGLSGSQDGDIRIDANVLRSSDIAADGLTLKAHDDIEVAEGVFLGTRGSRLDITFDADADAAGGGEIHIFHNAMIASAGGTVVLGAGLLPADTATGQADQISVEGGSTVTTRRMSVGATDPADGVSAGDSGDIVANSKAIDVRGRLLSRADGGFAGGDIVLTATRDESATTSVAVDTAVADAAVAIRLTDAVIEGRSVTARATADVSASATRTGVAGDNLTAFAGVYAEGNTVIVASGDVLLASETRATSSVVAAAASDSGGASAVAVITTTATARAGGTASISAGGSIRISARAVRSALTTADGSAAGATGVGGSSAKTTVNGVVSAEIADAARVQKSASLQVAADSTDDIATRAISTRGGGGSFGEALAALAAGSLAGAIPSADSLAVTAIDTATNSRIATTGLVASQGGVDIRSTATSASSATADAAGTLLQPGIGVAVAVNRPTVLDRAEIAGSPEFKAAQVVVHAGPGTAGGQQFSAQAISGGQSAGFSVAGAYARNDVDARTESVVDHGASPRLNGTPLTLEATGRALINAIARPGGGSPGGGSQPGDAISGGGLPGGSFLPGGSGGILSQGQPGLVGGVGGTFTPGIGGILSPGDGAVNTGVSGIGGSYALNDGDTLVRAEIEDAADVIQPGGISLSTDATDDWSALALAGGQGPTPNLGAAVAVNTGSDTARSRIGLGGSIDVVSGSVSVTAGQAATSVTKADGRLSSGSAILGAVIARDDLADRTSATVTRGMTVPLGITLAADGFSQHDVSAIAGTLGIAPAAGQDATQQVAAVGSLATALDHGNAPSLAPVSAPAGSSGSGSVGLAAALAINDASSVAEARLGTSQAVHTGAATAVRSNDLFNAHAVADAGRVGSVTGLGVAVALNDATQDTTARVAAPLSATGVSIAAGMSHGSNAAVAHEFTATAISGAGGGGPAAAGSLARLTPSSATNATVAGGAAVSAGGGDVSITAEQAATSTASATSASSASVGIGASVAANAPVNVTRAAVEDGTAIVTAHDLALRSKGAATITTTAVGGAAGGDAFLPAVAVTAALNRSSAVLGLSGGTAQLSGGLTVEADQTTVATTTADNRVAGTGVAVGAAVAINDVRDDVQAQIRNDVTAQGTAQVLASDDLQAQADAFGGAAGAVQVAGAATKADDQRRAAGDWLAGFAPPGGVPATPSLVTSAGSDGTNQLGMSAALAVDAPVSMTTADILSTVDLASRAGVTVAARSQVDGSATADASATDASPGNGAAIAVAVNLPDVSTTATIHDGAGITAATLNVEATTLTRGSDTTDDFSARAVSGGGGTDVGVAGGLALNRVERNLHAAAVGAGTRIAGAAGSGAIAVTSQNAATTAAEATAAASGGLGIGGSVAIGIDRAATTATFAGIASDAGSLAVTSIGSHATSVRSAAGAAGGTAVSPSVAVAATDIRTTATLEPSAVVHAAGDVSVLARGTSLLTTTAAGTTTGSNAAVGASIAAADSGNTVLAAIDTTAPLVAGGNVTVDARSRVACDSVATSGTRGARSDVGPTKADEQLQSQWDMLSGYAGGTSITSPSAVTADGAVGVAATIAVNAGDATTTARVGAAEVEAADVRVRSLANVDMAAVADAGGVSDQPTFGNQAQPPAVAAAVAVNAAHVETTAAVVSGTIAATGAVEITAGMLPLATGNQVGDHTDRFLAAATSGAGTANVGVAGSFALNQIRNTSEANVRGGASITAAGPIRIGSELDALTGARAQAATGGGSVGVGSSVAVDDVNNASTAWAAAGTKLETGAAPANLTIAARGDFDASIDAKAGQAGQGVGIAPAVAVGFVNNATSAHIDAGAVVSITGDLDVTADQKATTTTVADAAAAGAKVGVGGAVAVGLPVDRVTATIAGSVTVAGDVILQATSQVASTTTANAGMRGADPTHSAGGNSLDQQLNHQVRHLNDAYGAAIAPPPSAASREGRVRVAAAVAFDRSTATTRAFLDDASTITADGSVSLTSLQDIDAASTADASAVDTSQTAAASIGIAAAITQPIVLNEAATGRLATVTAGGIAVTAGMLSAATNTFSATSTSGAGQADAGVAGSFAMVTAGIGSNRLDDTLATLDGTLVSSGTVSASATGVTDSSATALSISGSSATGVGASVAFDFLPARAAATLQSTASLTGGTAGPLQGLDVRASNTHRSATRAEAGSAGTVGEPDGQDSTAVAAAVAVAAPVDEAIATLNAVRPVAVRGNVAITAIGDSETTTLASGTATGHAVAVGAMVSFAVPNATTLAMTSEDIVASGDVAIRASGITVSRSTANAGVRGAKPRAGDPDADTQLAAIVAFLGDKGVRVSALPSVQTQAGHVGVGAATAVNAPVSRSSASVAPSKEVSAQGNLSVVARGRTQVQTVADASGVGSAAADGTGIAIAINAVTTSGIDARIGSGAVVRGRGVLIDAGTDPGHSGGNSYEAHASSGTGTGDLGAAGSFAVNVIPDNHVRSTVSNLAEVSAGVAGAVITAENEALAKVRADAGAGSAKQVGLGSSFAVNFVENATDAAVQNAARVGSDGDVAMRAASSYSTETLAEAGGVGGDGGPAAVAVGVPSNDTSARLDSTGRITAAGKLEISAVSGRGFTRTTASGTAAGQQVATGGTIALTIGRDLVEAAHTGTSDLGGDAVLRAVSAVNTDTSAVASVRGVDSHREATASEQMSRALEATRKIVGDVATAPSDASVPTLRISEGLVSSSAAIAFNGAVSTATARVAGGDGAGIVARGAVAILSRQQISDRATADASAVFVPEAERATSGNYGNAVAINVVSASNAAALENRTRIEAHSLDVAADIGSSGGVDSVIAAATSGAGALDTAVMGAMALNVVGNGDSLGLALPGSHLTTATIGDEATVTLHGGRLAVSAVASTFDSATARGAVGQVGGGTKPTSSVVGVGASMAKNLLDHHTQATVGDRVSFPASSLAEVRIQATGTYDMLTYAEAGARGGTSALPASAFLYLDRNDAVTGFGAGDGSLAVSGDVTLDARTSSRAVTTADADVAAAEVNLGAALAVAVAPDAAVSRLDRSLTAGHDVTVRGTSNGIVNTSATAGMRGLDTDANAYAKKTLAYFLHEQMSQSVQDFDLRKRLGGIAQTLEDTITSEIPNIEFGAAAALNLAPDKTGQVHAETRASIGRGAVIEAGGAVDVESLVGGSRTANADGRAVNSPTDKTTFGAGIAYNQHFFANVALIEDAANVSAGDVHIVASQPMVDPVRRGMLSYEAIGIDGKGGEDQASFAGAVAVNEIQQDSHTWARVGAGTSVAARGSFEIRAQLRASVSARAGAQTEGLSSGAGMAVAVNVLAGATSADTGSDSRVDAGSSLILLANTEIVPPAAGQTAGAIGSSASPSGVAGSVAGNVVTLATTAAIGSRSFVNRSTDILPQPGRWISLSAGSSVTLLDRAGASALNATLGIGVGIAVNSLELTTDAFVGAGAVINASGDITIRAENVQDVAPIATTRSLSGLSQVAGATAITVSKPHTRAFLGDGSIVRTDGNVLVQAHAASTLAASAGSLRASGFTCVGGSNTTAIIEATTVAFVGLGASVTTHGRGLSVLGVEAQGVATVDTARGLAVVAVYEEHDAGEAVGGGFAGGPGLAGSVTYHSLNSTTRAFIAENATITATAVVPGLPGDALPGVLVRSVGVTSVRNTSGELSLTLSILGVGASADLTDLTKDTEAFIRPGVRIISSRDIRVEATSLDMVKSVDATADIGTSSGIAGTASIVLPRITTRAYVGYAPEDGPFGTSPARLDAAGNVAVVAVSRTDMDQISGLLGLSGFLGIGAALTNSDLVKTTEAFIGRKTVVNARAETGATVVPTLVPRIAPDAPGSASLANGEVNAPATQSTNLSAGGAATNADPALGGDYGYVPGTITASGVIVSAVNSTNLEQYAMGGTVADTLAINVSAATQHAATTTRAFIAEEADVNRGAAAGVGEQSVLVAAESRFVTTGWVGSLAAGTGMVGIGPGVHRSSIEGDTQAFIGGSAHVEAERHVTVRSVASEKVVSYTVGLAVGGENALAGSVGISDIAVSASASIAPAAVVRARGNVLVAADDATDVRILAGSAAAGFAVTGLAASVGSSTIHKDTRAFIDATASVDAVGAAPETIAGTSGNFSQPVPSTNAGDGIAITPGQTPGAFQAAAIRGLSVQASSREQITVVAASGGGGGYVGAAGGIVLNTVVPVTHAWIGRSTTINGALPGAPGQAVFVTATDALASRTIGGGLGVGFAGVGGGIDIGSIGSSVSASIDGDGTVVRATGDVVVNALSSESIRSAAISAAGGAAAVTGSVAVIGVNAIPDSRYSVTANGSSQSGNAFHGSGGPAADEDAAAQVSRNAAISAPLLEGVQPGSRFTVWQGRLDAASQQQAAGTRARAPSPQTVLDSLNHDENSGQRAWIASGATVYAGDDVDVQARQKLDIDVTAGAVGGGYSSLGASVVLVMIDTAETAFIAGRIEAGGDVTVVAEYLATDATRALAGGVGFVALGGAVNLVSDTSTQSAYIADGAELAAADSVVVNAATTQTHGLVSGQLTIGSIGIGGSFARFTAERDGDRAGTKSEVRRAAIGQDPAMAVHSLTVRSQPTLNVTVTAGAVEAGIGAAIAGSYAEANLSNAVTATIRDGAAVTTTGNIDVVSKASVGATSSALGITNAVTFAAGASIALVTLGHHIVTSIGDAAIEAGGTILVETIDQGAANARGVMPSFGSFAGTGVYVRTEAAPSIATFVSSTSLAARFLRIHTDSSESSAATGVGMAVGFWGVGAVYTSATVSGATRNAVGSGAKIRVGDLQIDALSRDTADATSWAPALGLTFAAGVTRPTASVRRSLVSDVDAGATVDSTGTVTVRAAVDAAATATAAAIAVGGAVGVGLNFADASATGSVAAFIAGSTTAAGVVQVVALDDERANATGFATGGAGAGSLQGGTGSATITHDVIAEIRAPVSTSGPVLLQATGDADAQARSYAASIAGFIAVGASVASASVDGSVGAVLKAPLTCSTFTVSATGTNNADATSDGGGAALVGAAAGSRADASVVPSLLGQVASSIHATGDGHITSSSSGYSKADGKTLSVAPAALGVTWTTATWAPVTTARLAVGADVVTDGGFAVTATNDSVGATASAEAPSGGIVAGGFSQAEAIDGAAVLAAIDQGATAKAGGAVEIVARGKSKADGTAKGLILGGAALGGTVSIGTANGTTRAKIDGNVADASSVTVQSHVTATATADTTGGGGALLISGYAAEATASVSPVSETAVSGTIRSRGSVTIDASASDSADARASALAGAFVAAGASSATAETMPIVNAKIALGAAIHSVGLAVAANQQTTEAGFRVALARTVAGAGGIAGIASSTAEATLAPSVSAEIDAGSNVDAGGGDVAVSANAFGAAAAIDESFAAGVVGGSADEATATAEGTVFSTVAASIVNAGRLRVQASPSMRAESSADAGAGGVAALTGGRATSIVRPAVGARLQSDQTTAGDIVVQTDVTTAGSATVDGSAYGVVGVGLTRATTTVKPLIRADVAAGTNLRSTGGSITVAAAHTGTSSARSRAAAAGAVGIADTEATAETAGNLDAVIGANAQITAARDVVVSARRFDDATASADANADGLGGGGFARPTATVDGLTRARLDSVGSIVAGRNVTVLGKATAHSSSTATPSAGGILARSETEAVADSLPIVRALVEGRTIVAGFDDENGSATILATASGGSEARSDSGSTGLLSGSGTSRAQAGWSPVIEAFVKDGTRLLAAGDVAVKALGNIDESGAVQTDRVSAYANAEADGLHGDAASDATVAVAAVTESHVGAAAEINAGKRVFVTAASVAGADSKAHANSDGAVVSPDARATVLPALQTRAGTDDATGSRTIVTARGGDVVFEASTKLDSVVDAAADGDGLGSASATATQRGAAATETTVATGSNTTINAGTGAFMLRAVSQSVGSANASADALFTDTTSTFDQHFGVTSLVGTNTVVNALSFVEQAIDPDSISVTALGNHVGGGTGGGTAKANADTGANVVIEIGAGVQISADTVEITAEVEDYRVTTTARMNGGAGDTGIATTINDKAVRVRVFAAPTAVINARSLSVAALAPRQGAAGYERIAQVPGGELPTLQTLSLGANVLRETPGVGTLGIGVATVSNDPRTSVVSVPRTASRQVYEGAERIDNTIDFRALVNVRTAATEAAFAKIAADGTIESLSGLQIMDGARLLTVGDRVLSGQAIVSQSGGAANAAVAGSRAGIRFSAPLGVVTGAPRIQLSETLGSIEIDNASRADIVLNGLSVLTAAAGTSVVVDGASIGTFLPTIASSATTAGIDVDAAGSVIIRGHLVNPAGTTRLHAAGDIRAEGAALVTTRLLEAVADTGAIGTSDALLPVQLIPASTGATSPALPTGIVLAEGKSGVSLAVSSIVPETPAKGAAPADVLLDHIESDGAIDVRLSGAGDGLEGPFRTMVGGVTAGGNLSVVASGKQVTSLVVTGSVRATGIATLATASGGVFTAAGTISAGGVAIRGNTIGTKAAPLVILSADQGTAAAADGDVFLAFRGDAVLGGVASTSGVVSIAAVGGIFEGGGESTAVSANGMSLFAATIGSADRPLVIAKGGAGVTAIATRDIDLRQAAGSLIIARCNSAVGNVRLFANQGAIGASALSVGGTVSAEARDGIVIGSDTILRLVRAVTATGDIRVSVTDKTTAGQDLIVGDGVIAAPQGSITLLAGDDLTVSASTVLTAAASIELRGDAGNADSGVGARMNISGQLQAASVLVAAGADDDVVILRNITSTAAAQKVNVRPNEGSDDIAVQTSPSVAFDVDGGTGRATDRLAVEFPGSVDLSLGGSGLVEIRSSVGGIRSLPVTFANIETLAPLRPSVLSQTTTITGDVGALPLADDIAILGRDVDSNTIAGDADGANEFMVVFNGAGAVPVAGTRMLRVATGAANDRVIVDPWADNSPVGWGIDLRIDLGAGSADELVYGGNSVIPGVDDTPDGSVGAVREEVTLAPSRVPGAGQIIVPQVTTITFTGGESVSFNLNDGSAGDSDSLRILGTDRDDQFSIDLGAATGGPRPLVDLASADGTRLLSVRQATNVDGLTIDGLLGADRFRVIPGTLALDVRGGSGTAIDTLNVLSQGQPLRLIRGATPDSGAFQAANASLIQFAGFESEAVDGRTIDIATPSATVVTVPAAGVRALGQALDFTVCFSAMVVVTGRPTLAITVGTTVRQATFVSGSGSDSLTFRYVVSNGDTDTDGVTVGGAIALNGGSIRGANSVNASLLLPAADGRGVLVDGVPATVTLSAGPANGFYKAGAALDFQIVFSEPVVVIGRPRIDITIGGASRPAEYVSGSGTRTLLFRSMVAAGDKATGLGVPKSITLPSGATIQDLAGNAAVNAFTPPATKGVVIDTAPPAVSSIGMPSPRTYVAGNELRFTLSWNETVKVTGVPTLPLTIGAALRQAAFVGGSGTNTLIFRYVIVPNDLTTGGVQVGRNLTLPAGAAIEDLAGNAGNLSLPTANGTKVLVDAVAPVVAAVTPPAAGDRPKGATLTVTVRFSEAVIVAGQPTIVVTIAGVAREFVYRSGSGSNTLTFSYTLTSAIRSTDAIRIGSSITLAGRSAIRDAAGNDAVRQFPS